MSRPGFAAVFLTLLTVAIPISVFACTGITIKPNDGSVLFARTLEFAQDIHSNAIIIPRGMKFVGSTPDGSPGLPWTTRYGAVGMNACGLPVFADGLNEKGLQVGVFYFPDYARYQPIGEQERDRSLAPQELSGFLLGTCASVEEAVKAAESVRVGEVTFSEFGFVLPLHYIVNDASGESVVLEYVDGDLKVHPNPLGVMSNSPTFDWHMTNLSNYVNLSVTNLPPLDLSGTKLPSLGQGSGMLGLPGDFTPPSRFIRAVAFSKSALPVETAREGVLQAFHILNQFDIPKGAARGREHGKEVYDYTLWTSASDLKNLRYYFRTYNNSRIRMIDLREVDLDARDVKTISIGDDEAIEDVSEAAR